MKVLTASVVHGQLDVPAGCFQDGDQVTLLIADHEEGFRLSAEQQQLLRESIAQADRGEVVDGWKLLAQLRD